MATSNSGRVRRRPESRQRTKGSASTRPLRAPQARPRATKPPTPRSTRIGSLHQLQVSDPNVRVLQLANEGDFRAALSRLTGISVTNACLRPSPGATACGSCSNCAARSLLPKLKAPWTLGKLNQALVLSGQRTMSRAFYRSFFPEGATDAEFIAGIAQFRAYAMLCFGGFRLAYAGLSTMEEPVQIAFALADYAKSPAAARTDLRNRTRGQALVDPNAIPLSHRWYLGYISDKLLVSDFMKEEALRWAAAGSRQAPSSATDRQRRGAVAAGRYEEQVQTIYQGLTPSEIRQWRTRLDAKRLDLEGIDATRQSVIRVAEQHSAAYLAASHIDVYVATSMRESWEFEAMGTVVPEIFGNTTLRPYRLTYFDPTLAYYESRFDKSLLEGLMINRAKATIYMVQETDTLGKDSELAATLAYGKPVIAYVPSPDATELAKELERAPLRRTFTRMFMLLSDSTLLPNSSEAKVGIRLASRYRPTFVLDEREEQQFRLRYATELHDVYAAVARAEIRSLNRRADNLISSHPLALQLRQVSGVACGLLVARTPAECAQLLLQVLTNDLSLLIDEQPSATVLREVSRPTSQAAFRVVTTDPILTNAFWTYWRGGSHNASRRSV